MNKIQPSSYSSQTSLFSSIIFFVIGAILFSQAEAVLTFVSKSLGIISIIIAIVNIITIYFSVKGDNRVQKRNIIAAAFFIFLAIIFLWFSNIVEQFIRFIIGAWILFSGIMRFISCISTSKKTNKFIPLLIVSIALMATGIFAIVINGIVLKTIGIIMMIYALIEIIGYIFYAKDTIEPEEPGTTTLIVPESEENTDTSRVVKTYKENDVKSKKEKKKKTTDTKPKKKKKNKKEDNEEKQEA